MQAPHSRRLVRASATFIVVTVALSLAGSASPRALSPAGLLSPAALRAVPWQGSVPNVRLAEVLFDPREGDTAFVELVNVGQAPVYLDSLVLTIDTLYLPLPPLANPIAGGGRAIIRFDGRGNVDGPIVHSSPGVSLRPQGGTVTLSTYHDRVLDHIAWGDAPAAFVPTSGGLAMHSFERGSSLGRPSGADRPGALFEWVVYAPDLVTPGQPNPFPPVAQLIPVDGAILEQTSVNLSWYPVPGAGSYRVQIATDSSFAQTVLDRNVTLPGTATGQLPAGLYWWRVQARPVEGPPAPWSRHQRIELGATIGGNGDADSESGPADESVSIGLTPPAPVLLPVPLIMQHKDSKMLFLESLQEDRPRTAALDPRVPHAWDRDHGTLDMLDPADAANCALASLAMMNRYYGKDLSQDRIGYEGWSRNINKYKATILDPAISTFIVSLIFTPNPADFVEAQVGPELDLHHGQGSPWGRLLAEGIFALGSLPGPNSGWHYQLTPDDMWKAIAYEIDHRRPVFAVVPGHAIVIRGYSLSAGRRLVYINDPWYGQYAMDLDANSGPKNTVLKMIWTYPAPVPQAQEPEVTKDSDGDGVVDFDETERFRTNPNKKDSDSDGVPDKEDIESGTYEAIHGYGYAYTPGLNIRGRDYDNDGIASELDPDSDNGGCKDGEEDLNGNGEWAANETDNFDATDDFCGSLQGNLSYRSEYRGSPQSMVKYGLAEGVILVRVKPEKGSPGTFIDDSSTFHYRGVARLEISYGTCILRAREVSSGGGRFVPPDGRIGIGVNDGLVAVDASMSTPSTFQAGGCGHPGGTGTQHAGLAFPDCNGHEVPAPNRKPGTPVIYRFKCSNSGTIPDGSSYATDVRGYLRLVPPPP